MRNCNASLRSFVVIGPTCRADAQVGDKAGVCSLSEPYCPVIRRLGRKPPALAREPAGSVRRVVSPQGAYLLPSAASEGRGKPAPGCLVLQALAGDEPGPGHEGGRPCRPMRRAGYPQHGPVPARRVKRKHKSPAWAQCIKPGPARPYGARIDIDRVRSRQAVPDPGARMHLHLRQVCEVAPGALGQVGVDLKGVDAPG